VLFVAYFALIYEYTCLQRHRHGYNARRELMFQWVRLGVQDGGEGCRHAFPGGVM
jgi:hypothetical protein